ncbi:sulfurtransferase TusA family protein [Kangiella sp. HZ709]|uniref:sulfurtransferase TusA family protein n=1 Tax=Kangiella sp. HZ709 TaxID=2666328 RepID=UPI0012B0BCC2|nr:sulfurtransferase TusA family protein [Kangiella sp. HZ709]MRX28247.1 recombinase [Kangiella sp. HZ709]
MSKLEQTEFLRLLDVTENFEVLECYRLLCPMPVIKTQNKLKDMHVGEYLKVICTDPGTMADIPTWSRINDITVIGFAELDDHTIQFLLRK